MLFGLKHIITFSNNKRLHFINNEDLSGNLIVVSNSIYTYTTLSSESIFKIDKNNLLWNKFYQFDSISNVGQYGAAINSSNESLFGFNYYVNNSIQNYFMKLDSNGNLVWINKCVLSMEITSSDIIVFLTKITM